MRSRSAASRWQRRAKWVAVVCDGVGQFGRSDEAAVSPAAGWRHPGVEGMPWPDAFARANEELAKIARETQPDDGADGMATTAVAVSVRRDGDGWAGEAAWVGDSTLWHLSAGSRWTLVTDSPATTTMITTRPESGRCRTRRRVHSREFRLARGRCSS